MVPCGGFLVPDRRVRTRRREISFCMIGTEKSRVLLPPEERAKNRRDCSGNTGHDSAASPARETSRERRAPLMHRRYIPGRRRAFEFRWPRRHVRGSHNGHVQFLGGIGGGAAGRSRRVSNVRDHMRAEGRTWLVPAIFIVADARHRRWLTRHRRIAPVHVGQAAPALPWIGAADALGMCTRHCTNGDGQRGPEDFLGHWFLPFQRRIAAITANLGSRAPAPRPIRGCLAGYPSASSLVLPFRRKADALPEIFSRFGMRTKANLRTMRRRTTVVPSFRHRRTAELDEMLRAALPFAGVEDVSVAGE